MYPMKTLLRTLFCCLVIPFIFQSCNPDEPGLNSNCSDFCDDAVVAPLANFSHGDCMSLCNTCTNYGQSDATSAVCLCNYIEDVIFPTSGLTWSSFAASDPLYRTITNKGKCVKFFKAAFANGTL